MPVIRKLLRVLALYPYRWRIRRVYYDPARRHWKSSARVPWRSQAHGVIVAAMAIREARGAGGTAEREPAESRRRHEHWEVAGQ